MEYVPSAPEKSKVPIAPMGFSHVLLVVCRVAVSMSLVAQWPSHCAPSVGTQLNGCAHAHKFPSPDGKYLVDMSNSILIFYDGCCLDLPEWSTCHLRLKVSHRATCGHAQKFPSPGKISDVLALSLACTTVRPILWSTTGFCMCSRDVL